MASAVEADPVTGREVFKALRAYARVLPHFLYPILLRHVRKNERPDIDAMVAEWSSTLGTKRDPRRWGGVSYSEVYDRMWVIVSPARAAENLATALRSNRHRQPSTQSLARSAAGNDYSSRWDRGSTHIARPGFRHKFSDDEIRLRSALQTFFEDVLDEAGFRAAGVAPDKITLAAKWLAQPIHRTQTPFVAADGCVAHLLEANGIPGVRQRFARVKPRTVRDYRVAKMQLDRWRDSSRRQALPRLMFQAFADWLRKSDRETRSRTIGYAVALHRLANR